MLPELTGLPLEDAEAALRAEEVQQLHAKALAVEVGAVVQDVGLDGDAVPVKGRAHADVRHGAALAALREDDL